MQHTRIAPALADVRAVPLPAPLVHIIGAELAPRSMVEAIIEECLRALDEADGDPDLEGNGDEGELNGDEYDVNGDESDHTRAEDEFGLFVIDAGAGCPIADPGGAETPLR